MLLGELRRWGLAREVVDELLPNAERALEWIENYGDLDGDGYVEYQRMTDRGLANQGWKDSADGIRYRDGTIAHAPIALCEVQAYVYSAYLARAHFAREAGDESTFERFRSKATRLEDRVQPGLLARGPGLVRGRPRRRQATHRLTHVEHRPLPMDRHRRPGQGAHRRRQAHVTGAEQRLGRPHPGIVDGGYNPMSYHCGSVWPHDTAIVAAGLARYGFMDDSLRLIGSLLDAALSLGGRLPELYCGLDRSEFSSPVAYPTSCSPQAWAAASPLLCLRTMLRLDPWVPYGKTWLSPIAPRGHEAPEGGGHPAGRIAVTVEVDGDDVEVTGLPPEVALITEPRHPATAV